MSESRQREIKHSRIRAGEFACVFCGGVTTAREPDHTPPRILFHQKLRPNDLVFPSCVDCNRGSSAIDTLVGWMGRSFPDRLTTKERQELNDLGKMLILNFPEVASAFYRDAKAVRPIPARTRAQMGSFEPINVDDPYLHRCIEFFGAKFGLGMHWKMTGQYVRPEGRVYSQWFTNAQAIAGMLPADLFKVFPKPRPLQQGTFTTAGRFEYDSVVDGPYTSHLAVFGTSFIVLAFVSPHPEAIFAETGALECEPGFLKIGYPYGLPRLSQQELSQRFERLRR